MFRIIICLFVVFCLGCSNYSARLNLPPGAKTITIDTVKADTPGKAQIIKDTLLNRLQEHYSIADDGDIHLSASVVYTNLMTGYINGATITAKDRSGNSLGLIRMEPSWCFYDDPDRFAQNVARILRKNQK